MSQWDSDVHGHDRWIGLVGSLGSLFAWVLNSCFKKTNPSACNSYIFFQAFFSKNANEPVNLYLAM